MEHKVPVARRDSRRKIDPEEAVRLYQQDPGTWTFTKLAEKYGVSRQAVSEFFGRLPDDVKGGASWGGVKPGTAWPWIIKREHQRGNSTYEAMLATRKMLEGKELNSRERSQAKAVLAFARRIDGVVTYDRCDGWAWTSRRDEDGDELFVARAEQRAWAIWGKEEE